MLQVFCLIEGIAESAPVEVSSFLCFCCLALLFYMGFVALGQEVLAQCRRLDIETAIGA